MRIHSTFLLLVAGALLAAVPVHAEALAPGGSSPGRDVAQTIWFQGYLADQTTADPIDGEHSVTVAIYDAELDGTLVWGPEAHNPVSVAAGWFIVELGSVTPLPSLDTPPYYVELAVDGETFEPRMKLASVPFALRADAAETTDDGDWVVEGGTVYPASAETLVIGGTEGMATLHVQQGHDGPLGFFGTSSTTGAATFHMAAGVDTNDSMVIGKVGPDFPLVIGGVPMAGKGIVFTSPGAEGFVLATESGPVDVLVGPMEPDRGEHALRITEYGHVGIGTTTPDTTLHVQGAIRTDAFVMETGAADGSVLTSDAGGNATWQAPSGVDGDWVVSGQDIYTGLTGNVGIGTPTPAAPLHIVDGGPYMSLYQTTGDSSTATMLVQAGSDVFDLLAVQKIGPSTPGDFVPGVQAAGLGAVTTGTSSTGLLLGSQGASPIHFVAANDEKMRMTADGKVGIGTASPDTTLHVSGGIKTNAFQMAPGGTTGYALTSDASGNGAWQPQHVVDTHETETPQTIPTSVGQLGGAEVSLTVPGPGLIVITTKVWVTLSHTTGTIDRLLLNHSDSSSSLGGTATLVYEEVPSEYPTVSNLDRTFTVVSSHAVASAGTYTFYLVGRMDSGGDASDDFNNCHMVAVYYPTGG